MKDTTEQILEEREKTHGDFKVSSIYVQAVKSLSHTAPRWKNMGYAEREAVDMIIHKLGRILYGTADTDHYEDIAGYAKLAVKSLQ